MEGVKSVKSDRSTSCTAFFLSVSAFSELEIVMQRMRERTQVSEIEQFVQDVSKEWSLDPWYS